MGCSSYISSGNWGKQHLACIHDLGITVNKRTTHSCLAKAPVGDKELGDVRDWLADTLQIVGIHCFWE